MNASVHTGPKDLPDSDQAPVFAEPWEAQAFALVLRLSEQGLFRWSEWTAALAAQISQAKESGDQDLGDTYYHYWLAALEKLLLGRTTTRALSAESACLRSIGY